ncbi:hypothetical protein NPIL_377711 [Nephila pilipes]|uniref:Uncharacterized protein n=1 Tax=Nephila pilipes TaxID=299642 RepID=A0A8X6NS35_NEPPI|nr:hypothetical protein NPIL_377711 [Nephila pilipes]
MMCSKINSVLGCSELGGKLNESVPVQCKKRFDRALLGTWIKKFNNEIREEDDSSDSNGGQLSTSSSREDDFWEDHQNIIGALERGQSF